MPVVLVEGITDRIALEAVAAKLGLDLVANGVEIVPIGGAQAIRRAAAEYEGERVVGLCDAAEERYFRRVLGEAAYVCVEDIEDELIRALEPAAWRRSSPRRVSSRASAAFRTSSPGEVARSAPNCTAGFDPLTNGTSAIRPC